MLVWFTCWSGLRGPYYRNLTTIWETFANIVFIRNPGTGFNLWVLEEASND